MVKTKSDKYQVILFSLEAFPFEAKRIAFLSDLFRFEVRLERMNLRLQTLVIVDELLDVVRQAVLFTHHFFLVILLESVILLHDPKVIFIFCSARLHFSN